MCGSSLSFASQANTDAMAWVRLWCNKRGSLEMCQMATTGTMCTPIRREQEHGRTTCKLSNKEASIFTAVHCLENMIFQMEIRYSYTRLMGKGINAICNHNSACLKT